MPSRVTSATVETAFTEDAKLRVSSAVAEASLITNQTNRVTSVRLLVMRSVENKPRTNTTVNLGRRNGESVTG